MTVTPPPAPVKLRSQGSSWRRRAPWVLVLIPLVFALVVVTGVVTSKDGSTYSHAPGGYHKWYVYMQKQPQSQGKIQRWRRDYSELLEQEAPNQDLIESQQRQLQYVALDDIALDAPQTMVRISNAGILDINTTITADLREWAQKGNTIIQMGWYGRATDAPFQSKLSSSVGPVLVETTRRRERELSGAGALLKDDTGAVAWIESEGKGKIIHVTYPLLAANAHAEETNNFAFLGRLASQAGGQIWVDEWMHGFRDRKSQNAARRERDIPDVQAYIFRTTPALALLIQGIVITSLLIWGKNWRFGPLQVIRSREIANSERYVQALAGVLNQARHTDFVLAQLGLRLRQQLASQLGLAADRAPTARLPDDATLAQAWTAQTGQSAQEVLKLLQQADSGRRLSDAELVTWAAAAAALATGKGVQGAQEV
jgi:hypothetical protein